MAKVTAWSEENVSLTTLRDLRNQPTSGIDTLDRGMVQSVTLTSISSGLASSIRMAFFTPTRTLTVSSMTTVTAGTAANYGTATGLNCRMALYTVQSDTSATLVAQTDHDPTLWVATNTPYARNFSTTGGYPATYTLLAGTRYAAAVILSNTGGSLTTSPSIAGVSGPTGVVGDLAPRIAGFLSATSLPTAPTAISGSGTLPWFRLS